MAAAQRAIPSHMRDGATNGESASAFKRNHHGKSQSHVVSLECFLRSINRVISWQPRYVLFWASGSAGSLVSKQSVNLRPGSGDAVL